MPALTTAIAALGLLAAAGGTAASVIGAQKQASAEKQLAQQQQTQMNLDAARSRRNIARQAILSRSQALSNATNSGAGFGSSSGVAGGQSGITSQAGVAGLGLSQNTSIANTSFGLQHDAFNGGTLAATGGAISSFGSMMMQQAPTIAKVGGYIMNGGGWGSTPTYA